MVIRLQRKNFKCFSNVKQTLKKTVVGGLNYMPKRKIKSTF